MYFPLVEPETQKPGSDEANRQERLDYNSVDLSDLYSQVLQKLGKTVETKDERFEQSASNFHQQQVIWRMGMGSLEEERRCEGWVAEQQQVLQISKHPF